MTQRAFTKRIRVDVIVAVGNAYYFADDVRIGFSNSKLPKLSISISRRAAISAGQYHEKPGNVTQNSFSSETYLNFSTENFISYVIKEFFLFIRCSSVPRRAVVFKASTVTLRQFRRALL